MLTNTPNSPSKTSTIYGEFPDVQAGFRKGRGTRDQIANIRWLIEKAREFQKNVYFCFIDYTKGFDCVDHNKLWEILKKNFKTYLLRNMYAGFCKQQLELDIKQQTRSKLGQQYVKAVYCHPAYLPYMQSTSCKFQAGWSASWNQDCQEKYQ